MAKARDSIHHLWDRLLMLLIVIPAPSIGGTELLEEVCKRTSNYTFCVTTLTADPNAGGSQPLAGEFVNAALRLAQTKAIHAQSLIPPLFKMNASTTLERNSLQKCQSSNEKALSQLSSANNDFNSDSLDSVVEEVNTAATATKVCLNEIQGKGGHFSPLATVMADLFNLCEICIVSTGYFTVEDFY